MIVGVGQITDREMSGLSPIELLVIAVETAARDSGQPTILDIIDEIAVVRISTQRLEAPGALLAEALGVKPARTISTKHGGHNPQVLVNRAVTTIRNGDADVILIGGAESQRTVNHYRNQQLAPDWPTNARSNIPNIPVGSNLRLGNDVEASVGLRDPVHYYSLFETALALKSRDSIAEHVNRGSRALVPIQRGRISECSCCDTDPHDTRRNSNAGSSEPDDLVAVYKTNEFEFKCRPSGRSHSVLAGTSSGTRHHH